ncbi:two-component system sensor histidine kinase NtrB [Haloarchaeobius sp. TZWWS8]|uniref:two-component system sensor histidine kinase NtrB n=1 Tax=Haloarchaeobius sp. TZWWS8 TaxID=3446121 RepID=UPI003EBD389C
MPSAIPKQKFQDTVVLLLVHKRNRELLTEWLSKEFAVKSPGEDELPTEFDLCIFDLATFSNHRAALERVKKEAEPLFLPYLLVHRERERMHVKDDIWQLIDDRVVIPTSQAELGARVNTLLTARWQSLELQERREHEIRQERAFTESALRALPDIFYVFDDSLRLTRWNEEMTAVTGHSDAELAGKSLDEFVGESSRRAVRRLFQQVVSTGETTQVESTLVTRDGDEIPYELTAARLPGADGETRGLVGVGRDVTDRALRRELARQNERLEQFASIVSHDLRNPLTVAGLNLELGRETGDDRYLEKTEQALGRMSNLIDDMLTLARKGEVVEELESVSFPSVVSSAWSVIDHQGATLNMEFPREQHILADEWRLHDLLANLFRNSIEHGSDAVTVHIGLLDDEPGFFVEDDGLGIPLKDRGRVFEYGYSTNKDGTGFGLTIVESIAEAHGWEITVADGRTGGARFEIRGVDFGRDAGSSRENE